MILLLLNARRSSRFSLTILLALDDSLAFSHMFMSLEKTLSVQSKPSTDPREPEHFESSRRACSSAAQDASAHGRNEKSMCPINLASAPTTLQMRWFRCFCPVKGNVKLGWTADVLWFVVSKWRARWQASHGEAWIIICVPASVSSPLGSLLLLTLTFQIIYV